MWLQLPAVAPSMSLVQVWRPFVHLRMVTQFQPCPTVEQTLTVSKAAKLLLLEPFQTKTYAGVYTLSASASSGLGVSFTSSDSSIASVSENVATLAAGGTVQITANQGGNSIYAQPHP